MESFNIFYSVLKYIPSPIRMESIIVGLAVHSPLKKFSHFYRIKNTRRVVAFDDEYNKDFFKMVMDSLAYDLDYSYNEYSESLFNDDIKRFSDIEQDNFLDTRISYLANEFQFSPIESLQTSDSEVKNDLENLQKMYLYLTYPTTHKRAKDNRLLLYEVKG